MPRLLRAVGDGRFLSGLLRRVGLADLKPGDGDGQGGLRLISTLHARAWPRLSLWQLSVSRSPQFVCGGHVQQQQVGGGGKAWLCGFKV